jgi:hypothetical protein
MDTTRATEILRSLADGRDPATGEQFPPNSPYQQADTVRALYVALEALEKGGRRREPRPVDPNKPKAGGAWSPQEEQQLREEFAARKSFSDIAAAHGRTTGAITARLVKLGLIEDTSRNRGGAGNRPPGLPPAPIRPTRPIPSDSAAPRPAPPRPAELTEEEKDNLPF